MSVLGIILIFLLGQSVLMTLLVSKSILLRLGFGFPVGFGVVSLLMFFLNLVGVGLTSGSITIAIILLILVFAALGYKNWVTFYHSIQGAKWKLPTVNFAWLFFIGVVLYLCYGLIVKTLFWPTAAYDSVAGYMFLAKVIAQEGLINNSIFDLDLHYFSARTLYPPLVPLVYSYFLMIGYEDVKMIVVLFLVSAMLGSYAVFKIGNTHFTAALLTFLLFISPELIAMAALSLTNVPQMIFTFGGLGLVYHWFRTSNQEYFKLGVLLLSLGVWCRTEGIIFVMAGAVLVAIKSFNTKRPLDLVLYLLPAISLFVVWELYVKNGLQLSQFKQPFQYQLFWDSKKLGVLFKDLKLVTFEINYYGIVVYLFLLTVVLNLKERLKPGLELLMLIIVAWVLYVIVYYQIDNFNGETMANYITAGYKRGFFNFLPLLLLYVGSEGVTGKLFNKYLAI